MDIEQIRQEAQDESTTPEILTEFAKSEDRLTRKYVASNSNTSLETLKEIAKEFPDEVLNNPVLDLLILENPQSNLIQLLLARSSITSIETLVELSECDDREILETVVENSNTPSSVLDKLPIRICKDRLTPTPWLRNGYSQFSPTPILCAIARHPNATIDTLDKLIEDCHCYDGDESVCRAILENQKIAVAETLEKMPLFIRKHIAERWQDISPEIANTLARDKCKEVRHIIAIRADKLNLSLEIINNLAQDEYEEVRCAVARHIRIPENIANTLALDSSEKVRCAVACRQYISENIANTLALDSSQKVRYQIAKHKTSKDVYVRLDIAGNPNTPAKTLDYLKNSKDIHILAAIARHPNTPAEILKSIL